MDAIAALGSALSLGQVQLAAATKVARVANQQPEAVLQLLDAVVEDAVAAFETGLGAHVDAYA